MPIASRPRRRASRRIIRELAFGAASGFALLAIIVIELALVNLIVHQ